MYTVSESASSIRSFIPSGACVGSGEDQLETVEVFERLDTGESTDVTTDVALAREACRSCVQLTYCQDQTDIIATEMWKRGASQVVIGTETVAASVVPHVPEDLTEPIIRFNLSEMRQTSPQEKLELLRQGARTRQLRIESQGAGCVNIAAQALALVRQKDAGIAETAEALLGNQYTQRTLTYIATVICQAADFENYSKGKSPRHWAPSRHRYDPDCFDYAAHYPVIKTYLEEVIKVRELGLTNPAVKAINHGAAFYERLIQQEKDGDFTDAIFDNIIEKSLHDPLHGIRRYKTRLARERAKAQTEGRKISEAALRKIARQTKDGTTPKEISAENRDWPSYITPSLRRNLACEHSDAEQAIADLIYRVDYAGQVYGPEHPRITLGDKVSFARNSPLTYMESLALLDHNLAKLMESFGEHEAFTPGIIRQLAAKSTTPKLSREENLAKVLAATESYLGQLQSLREKSDGSIPDSYLRDAALKGKDSFYEIRKQQQASILNKRLVKLAERGEGGFLDSWIINRVLTNYPFEEAEQVCVTLNRLLQEEVITLATAEENSLLEPEAKELLARIRDPRTGNYLAFSANAQVMDAKSRLMFAHATQLGPLLYGYPVNSLQIMDLFGFIPSDELVKKRIIAKALEITHRVANQNQNQNRITAMPLPQSAADLTYLQPQAKQASMSRLGRGQMQPFAGTRTVIGAELLQLTTPETHKNTTLAPAQEEWLLREAGRHYPPGEQLDAIAAITEALTTGILVIEGEEAADFRLFFSPHIRQAAIGDLERAALAHITRADRLLYGVNLGPILAERLQSNNIALHVERSVTPKIQVLAEESRNNTESPIPVLQPDVTHKPRPAKARLDSAPLPADTIKLYMNEIGRTALLRAEEEVELAKSIEIGAYASQLKEHLKTGGGQPVPATTWAFYESLPEEERTAALLEDLSLLVTKGEKSKKRFIEANLRLPIKMAQFKANRTHDLEFEDLVQEGNLALIRALEMFDYQKCIKFSTYAMWWIRQTMDRAIEDKGSTIRLSNNAYSRLREVRNAIQDFTHKEGRQPNDEELSKAVGISVESLKELQLRTQKATSFNQKIRTAEEEEKEFLEVLADPDSEIPLDSVEDDLLRAQIRKEIDNLPEWEAKVLRLLFGVDGEPLTLEGAAEKLPFGSYKVRTLRKKGLQRLRDRLQCIGITSSAAM